MKLKSLLAWLRSAPQITTIRVNTQLYSSDHILKLLTKIFNDFSDNIPVIEKHLFLPDVILVHNVEIAKFDLTHKEKEVIIDSCCGEAVLRGANIFAPGVIGMHSNISIGDKVSVYVDLERKCKKGYQKTYTSKNKTFVGNGYVKMNRFQLFGKDLTPTGVAIEMYAVTSGCPKIDQSLLPVGSCLLQNLPSIICSYVLSPQPGDVILDMCASPGNKTTHIAALMNNKGKLIAIDKTPTKVKQLQHTCNVFGANVAIFQADSCKIYNKDLQNADVLQGPPFSAGSFDRILLDAPCSCLGKRPQLSNDISQKVLQSYPPLQRKLLKSAVPLLKPNGCLVYSTCTYTLQENEQMVAWALKTFSCLKLQRAEPYMGSPGWKGSDLTDVELRCIQRFDNTTGIDSIGFFIASFIKIDET